MKDLLFRLAAGIPDAAWDRLSPEACLLPYYHMVSDEVVPHVSPLYHFRSVADFSADLDRLLRGRQAVSLDQFLAVARTFGHLPEKSFLLTFDDGFSEMHDVVLPILLAKGVPAVFFLTSATLDNTTMCHHQKISLLLDRRQREGSRFPDAEVARRLTLIGIDSPDIPVALASITWTQRAVLDELGPICGLDFAAYTQQRHPYLTPEQVKTMLGKGMAIGAHSIDHPRYADIPLAEQLRQTRESMTALVQRFALKQRAFAFPHTDRGVSQAFFKTVFDEGTLDLSFGTSGPATDSAPLNFQRFTMEKTRLPAGAILARHRMKHLRQRAAGRTLITRS